MNKVLKGQISFEKNGHTFTFRNPYFDSYNKMVMDYKYDSNSNEYDPEGFFHCAEFNLEKKYMKATFNIDKKEFGAVTLPDKEFEIVKKWYNELLAVRNEYIENTVNALIQGTKMIEWGIVGCDFPSYQPWISVDDNYSEQDIMGKAITRILKSIGASSVDTYVSNACDYLEKRFGQRLATMEEMNKEATNIKLDAESQQNHDLVETVVTNFETTLKDAMRLSDLAETVKEKRAAEEETAKAKAEMKVEVLKKGTENSCEGPTYYANVKITDSSTGESLNFVCRNIFDFGYVINPDYAVAEGVEKGGLENNGKWQSFNGKEGWCDVRELTELEKKCINYLHKFPPVYTGINM